MLLAVCLKVLKYRILEIRLMLIVEIGNCKEKDGWRAIDSRNAGRIRSWKPAMMMLEGHAACAFNKLVDLILSYTQQSWFPNS
jgi:hypothetical protein